MPEVRWLAEHVEGARIIFESNSSRALLDACVAGLGIALLPSYAAAYHPNLVELAIDVPTPAREIWLVTHRDVVKVARVRALSTFLVDLFKTESARLVASRGAAPTD